MSKIEKELCKATGVSPEDHKGRQAFLVALMKAIPKLDDKAWDGLSDPAQDWYNKNADVRNKAKKADKELPDVEEFPDVEKAKEEEERPRTRRASSEEDEKPKAEPRAMKKGDRVKVVTKRGKTIEGKVVELGKTDVVIKDGEGEEHELDLDRLESTEIFHGDAEAGDEKKSSKPAAPQKGDKVEVVTKRGKKVVGKLLAYDDKEVVVKDGEGEEHEFDRERVESVTVLGGGEKAKEEDEKPRGKAKDDGDDGDKKKRASNPEGVSVSQRIYELMAGDPELTKEDLVKKLTKEGLEFKENTVALNYASCTKFLAALKEAGRLKA